MAPSAFMSDFAYKAEELKDIYVRHGICILSDGI
jgi:hypothetical protein